MKTILIHSLSICILSFFSNLMLAQANVVKDIKSFGAKGNGKTNDQLAFQKAADYFNKRGGNGTLTISKGTYIIGKQNFTGGQSNKPAYEGEDVLHFIKVKNLKIRGTTGTILKYIDSLRLGAFDPDSGKPYESGNNFRKYAYAAFAGSCIYLDSCDNVSVTNLTLDGNSQHIILGGVWGDVGRQLTHYGIFIKNSTNIQINKVNAHYFGLDGIGVYNSASRQQDNITLLNSSFEYNSRQGLSWTGGNSLVVENCKFNHIGRGKFASPPSAGVDIEAEIGPVKNGVFTNCEFVDNVGVALLASTGNDSACTFNKCTFWGINTWSIWVTKPAFTFTSCNIYGSIVHGYDSPDDENATKFLSCTFEDKPYMGKEAYGNFLIESNYARRVSFTNCTFIANKKRLFWVMMDPKKRPQEKYQFVACNFIIKNADYPQKDAIGIMKGMRLKNCTFDFKHPAAKAKGYVLSGYAEGSDEDLGGNKIIYSKEK